MNRITLGNFDELLLEAREFLFANEEWMLNGSGRGVHLMEEIVREFQLRFQVNFEPEPVNQWGDLL